MSNFFTSLDWKKGRVLFLFRFSARTGSILALVMALVGGWGCATDSQYREAHVIKDLNVVFVDQQTLHNEWKSRTGRDGVQLGPSYGGEIPSVKTLKGFYDFTTSTLYCPKWNFAVCGHELHHAALGHFHDKE